MPRAVIVTRAHVAVFTTETREALALALVARTLAVVAAGFPLAGIAGEAMFAPAASLGLFARTVA